MRKKIIEKPIHEIRYSRKNGARPDERRKQRKCRYCNAPNWKPNHECPARELICHNCRTRQFAIVCRSEHQTQQRIEEITEPKETEERETDNLMSILTKIKHVTDRKNPITMTKKIDEIEKELLMYTRSLVKILQPDTEIIENRENHRYHVDTRTLIKTKWNSPQRLR